MRESTPVKAKSKKNVRFADEYEVEESADTKKLTESTDVDILGATPSSVVTLEKWQKLSNLKELFDQGFITGTEYKERKMQLVDELTGTRSAASAISEQERQRKERLMSAMSQVEMEPDEPMWDEVRTERAIEHTFDPVTHLWGQHEIFVKVAPKPFARGALRFAYYMRTEGKCASVAETYVKRKKGQVPVLAPTSQSLPTKMLKDSDDLSMASIDDKLDESVDDRSGTKLNNTCRGHVTYVVKISIDPMEDRETYFQDVETQMYAKEWAVKFNYYNPPKAVDFVKAACLELPERPNSPICGVERYIDGEYRKHNNNYGYVNEDERNTPQAFSHFTYHASKGTTLICDIQGVGDLYTDPQMHTVINQDFGRGNLGQEGFKKFLQTHRCNAICQYFRLPSINAKLVDAGTAPATRFMHYRSVDVIDYSADSKSSYYPLAGNSYSRYVKPKSRECCGCTLL
mmetsp:Transcript_7902/g.19912  ORF Transcript_7902/g.19912 Transcript_7902/m.19912 type:complete len:459 (-) Transcript_7902:224-1600(-)|eukprot:CAMPEP_0177678278 /NCGR_PEP_ID=MMETSP0447-20121125/28922_1 /TAXON_ID=0 /ORGANISM="Stygamoeba regulata, Strain BSH-02190019" /LENGTH=458 /DNA_ID=CAMNT_0019187267 /DNA_START=336 /DNA_END=1712 /DNA_ORIENTATION=-